MSFFFLYAATFRSFETGQTDNLSEFTSQPDLNLKHQLPTVTSYVTFLQGYYEFNMRVCIDQFLQFQFFCILADNVVGPYYTVLIKFTFSQISGKSAHWKLQTCFSTATNCLLFTYKFSTSSHLGNYYTDSEILQKKTNMTNLRQELLAVICVNFLTESQPDVYEIDMLLFIGQTRSQQLYQLSNLNIAVSVQHTFQK